MSYTIGFVTERRPPVPVDTRFNPNQHDAVGSAANRVMAATSLPQPIPGMSPIIVSSRIDSTQHDVPGRRDRAAASSTVHVGRAVLSHPAPQLLPVSMVLQGSSAYLPPRAIPMLPRSPTLTARPPFRPAGAVQGGGLTPTRMPFSDPPRTRDTRLGTGHDKVGTRT